MGTNDISSTLPSMESSMVHYQNDLSSLNIDNVTDELRNVEVWVPISICLLGIFCAIIFLIVNKIFGNDKVSDIDSNGSIDRIISVTDDENEDNDIGKCMNDQVSIYDIDLTDCTPISSDIYVTQKVISIDTPRNVAGSSPAGLVVPSNMLRGISGSSSISSSGSELDLSIDVTQKYVMNISRRLSVIQDVDVECFRMKSIADDSSSDNTDDQEI